MRVTDTILSKNFLSNLKFSAERLFEKETRVLTNKSINKPSDNPVDALNSLTIRTRLNEISQYQRNISRTKNTLLTTETYVTQLSEIFQRVNELTVQAASDSYGPTDKISIAGEVNQLLEQLLNAANTKSESTYIFAGTNNDIAPYTATRDEQGDIIEVKTVGSGGDIIHVIGDSITLKANINGEDLFEGGENLFNILIKVRDDCRLGATDNLRQDLFGLEEAGEKINNTLAVLGSRTNRIEAAETRAESDEINFSVFLSSVEDIDASEAIMDYQMELLTLQSALQVGARLLQPRLGDFLR